MCKYVKYLRVLSQNSGGKGPSYVESSSTIHLLSPSNIICHHLYTSHNVSPPIKSYCCWSKTKKKGIDVGVSGDTQACLPPLVEVPPVSG